jgi:beta-glucosidase
VISLEKDATYDLLLSASSAGLALAQTGCNLLLNGCVVATIQTHGALGKQITQKLCRIDMTAGNYLLQFEATKPGMVIDWLEFRQVTD